MNVRRSASVLPPSRSVRWPRPRAHSTNNVSIKPGAVLVNALLQWPEEDRLALAILLQDSVKERFTSLEQNYDENCDENEDRNKFYG